MHIPLVYEMMCLNCLTIPPQTRELVTTIFRLKSSECLEQGSERSPGFPDVFGWSRYLFLENYASSEREQQTPAPNERGPV